jgi:hypothetical protein
MRERTRAVGLVCLVGLAVGCSQGTDTEENAVDPGASGGGAGVASGGHAGAPSGGGAGGAKPVGADAGRGGAGTAAAGGGPAAGGDSGTGGSPAAGGTQNVGGYLPAGTPPDLKPGVWTDITPRGLNLSAGRGVTGSYGAFSIAFAPSNTAILYANIDNMGVWKSKDGGTSWVQLGNPKESYDWGDKVTYFQTPCGLAVDPADSEHVYVTQGVRCAACGFWISHDGGNNWQRPKSFYDHDTNTGVPDTDATTLIVDPADFSHVIVGTHGQTAYVYETEDGGGSWKVSHPPIDGGSFGMAMLYHPESGTGDRKTWVVMSNGFHRTTDAGATWTKVSDTGGVHGATETYYTKSGVIYSAAGNHPVRSTDNGLTWTAITQGLDTGKAYYTIHGDGTSLYTQWSLNFGAQPGPIWMTSPESDGLSWKPYGAGTQHFFDGALHMAFDPSQRIMYSANWDAGLWALKVTP